MAVTQAQIDELNAAIASAEKQVALGAQQVTYRSISELIAARNDLQRQLDAQSPEPVKSRMTRLIHAGRGYD
jgi:predicted component of type VI protein secretion system